MLTLLVIFHKPVEEVEESSAEYRDDNPSYEARKE